MTAHFSHEEKTSADLIPQHTRVAILCEDLDCQKASIITIIEKTMTRKAFCPLPVVIG